MLKSKGEASVLRKSGRFFTLEIHRSHGTKFPHGARSENRVVVYYPPLYPLCPRARDLDVHHPRRSQTAQARGPRVAAVLYYISTAAPPHRPRLIIIMSSWRRSSLNFGPRLFLADPPS